MKALITLNNEEMAKLLFDLLPNEIPAFLNYIKSCNSNWIANQEELAKNWDNGLLSFETWLDIAESVSQSINRQEAKITKQGKLFAEELFGGYRAIWTRYCAEQFQWEEQCSGNFKNVVRMLFDREQNSLPALRKRADELESDTEKTIRKTCEQLQKYSKEPSIDIDTTGDDLYIGLYDNAINGYPQLTGIRLDDTGMYIELDRSGEYLPFDDQVELSIHDKFNILSLLRRPSDNA